MKIIIATAVYYPMINGVAVFSHNLALGLARRGHEVMVICPSQTGKKSAKIEDGVKVCRLRSIDVKVYPDQIHDVPDKKRVGKLNLPRLIYRHGFRVSVFPQPEINKLMDEFQPDVVHVQVSDPIGLSVVWYAKKHDVPVVTTEHNQPEVITEPLKMPKVVKKPMDAMLSAYFRNRQSKSDFVTMPTEQAIHNLLDKSKKDLGVPVAAVSNGVDLSSFKPGKANKAIFQKFSLPDDKPIVLYVGRVDPEKKVGFVVEAFKEALSKVPEALLVIVGDGVDKERLSHLVNDCGMNDKVRFLGKVLPPDLYELYKIGWVFATASPIETQGIVLIEAAACGLPLIAVNKGAVSEVCHSNENGYLCEVGSGEVDEMAEAMVKILTDDEKGKKFAARSVEVAGEHDFNKTLDKFENIYRKVISG